jgi:hypothetical protein
VLTTASQSSQVEAARGPEFFEPIILAEYRRFAEHAGRAFLQRTSDWSSIEK